MGLQIHKGFRQLVSEAEEQVNTLTPQQVADRQPRPGTILVDLRDIREVKREGKIAGALHVPRGMLEFWIDPDSPYYRREFDQASEVILYCNKGWRSALAAKSLVDMGVTTAAHMAGGLERWLSEDRPIDKPEP